MRARAEPVWLGPGSAPNLPRARCTHRFKKGTTRAVSRIASFVRIKGGSGGEVTKKDASHAHPVGSNREWLDDLAGEESRSGVENEGPQGWPPRHLSTKTQGPACDKPFRGWSRFMPLAPGGRKRGGRDGKG